MSRFNPRPYDVELGNQSQVLMRMTLIAFGLALLGGTFSAITSLTRVLSIVFPVVNILFGFFIVLASYRVTYNKAGNTTWMVTKWNHAILVSACIFAGIWLATLQTGICYAMTVSKIAWMQALPITCRSVASASERLVAGSIIGAATFLLVPFLFALFYVARR